MGAGTVGIQAAKMAAGLGAHVTILDINMKRLRHVNDIMPSHVVTEFSNEFNIRKHIQDHDLIVGGVLLKGAKAPNLITRDMLKEMRPGTVIVDVAVDQGGCVETTKPHTKPRYILLTTWCTTLWRICLGQYHIRQPWRLPMSPCRMC